MFFLNDTDFFLGVELHSILNPKRSHKFIFDDTSPYQYPTSTLLSISCGIVAIVLSRYLAHTSLRWAAVTLSIINAVVSAACTVGLTVSVIITVANEGRTLLSTCTFSNLQLIQISHECPFDPTRIYSTTLCLWVISIILDAAEMVFSARCYFIVLQLMDVHLCHKKKKKYMIYVGSTCFIGFSRLLEALRRRGTTSVPLVDAKNGAMCPIILMSLLEKAVMVQNKMAMETGLELILLLPPFPYNFFQLEVARSVSAVLFPCTTFDVPTVYVNVRIQIPLKERSVAAEEEMLGTH
ncbi:unnamed protein product, partial [Ranitomeya imitator]